MGTVTYVDFRKDRMHVGADQGVQNVMFAHMRSELLYGCAMLTLALFAHAFFLFRVTNGEWYAPAIFIGVSVPILLGAMTVRYRYCLKHGYHGTFSEAVRDVVSDLRVKQVK